MSKSLDIHTKNRLVVASTEWAKDLPDWLLKEVEYERMALGLGVLVNPNTPKVGDAEVLVYLNTLSLRQPINTEQVNIYSYLLTRIMEKRSRKVPKEIRTEKITDWEEHQLNELRRMIYTKRGGDIKHPMLDVMRELKGKIRKVGKKNKGQAEFLFEGETEIIIEEGVVGK